MSPRAKLLNNKALADKVRDMVDGDVFDTAADAALLNYVMKFKPVEDSVQAAQSYNRIVGAVEYLAELRTITDVPKPTATPLPDNLNFKA